MAGENQIATVGSGAAVQIASRIEAIASPEEARACIEDMDFLKAALQKARKYHEYLCEYAVLECEMWFKIADVFPWNKRTPKQFSRSELVLLNWIEKLTPKDREQIIYVAQNEGASIYLQKKESLRKANQDSKTSGGKRVVDELINQLNESGKTSLDRNSVRYAYSWFCTGQVGDWELSALLDRARIELRKRGAVGVGDESHTYLLPEKASDEDKRNAISIRLDSIINDIAKVCELIEQLGLADDPNAIDMMKVRKIQSMSGRLAFVADRTSHKEVA